MNGSTFLGSRQRSRWPRDSNLFQTSSGVSDYLYEKEKEMTSVLCLLTLK